MITPPPRPTSPLSMPASNPTTTNKAIVCIDINRRLRKCNRDRRSFLPERVVIGLYRLLDDLQRRRLIPEFLHHDRLVLQLLVLFEEMPQLLEEMLVQVLQVVVVVHDRVL